MLLCPHCGKNCVANVTVTTSFQLAGSMPSLRALAMMRPLRPHAAPSASSMISTRDEEALRDDSPSPCSECCMRTRSVGRLHSRDQQLTGLWQRCLTKRVRYRLLKSAPHRVHGSMPSTARCEAQSNMLASVALEGCTALHRTVSTLT